MKNPANMIGGFGKFCLMYSFFLVANIFVVQNLRADPKSVSGYAISVFATAPSNFTGPDSITSAHGNIFVSYTNGAAKDGSSGSSVIVQYDTKGTVLHTYTVAGRNDGLKYNPYDKMLWALRNEDGNPQLTLINPETGASQDLTYAVNPPAHGGGYDDVAFLNGKVYLSASNPTVDAKGQNNFPSIVSATIVGSKVQVAPVLLDNAVLTNITTGSKTTSLQSDPDSLKIGPDHALFLTSQADGDFIFVSDPSTDDQSARLLHLTDGSTTQVTVDDTVFPSRETGILLVADTSANKVYAIVSSNFEVGKGYSASDSDGAVGTVDMKTGKFTAIVAGLGSPHGELFLPGHPKDEEGDH